MIETPSQPSNTASDGSRRLWPHGSRGLYTVVLAMIGLAVFAAGAPVPTDAAKIADGFQCYKFNDSFGKKPQRFDAVTTLTPANAATFGARPGCRIKPIKAGEYCVPTALTVTDADGAPLTGNTGIGQSDSMVCYKVKCPDAAVAGTLSVSDPFASRDIGKFGSKPRTVCIPAAFHPLTTTTVVTTSTTVTTTIPTRRVVFLSSAVYPGNFSSSATADDHCTTLARDQGYKGIFRAWNSTQFLGPSTLFTRNGLPWRLPNGDLVANTWDDLVDGTIQNPINVFENGDPNTSGNTRVFTGTQTSGAPNSNHCSEWSTQISTFTPGDSSRTDASWTDTGATIGCH